MYLNRIFLRNFGPIEEFNLRLPFSETGAPLPLILVGANGSGKTNVLSVAADAIFESAAQGFSDVLPQTAGGRSFFRILSPLSIRNGAPASLSVVKLTNGDQEYFYAEKNGVLTHEEALAQIPPELHAGASWPENEERAKRVTITPVAASAAFDEGAYCYFPASRAEKPDWLNSDGVMRDEFAQANRFSGQLQRPLFVESGIGQLAQWIMSVIVEARADVSPLPVTLPRQTAPTLALIGQTSLEDFARNQLTLQAINRVLGVVLGDPTARFVWIGRHSPNKIGIMLGNQLLVRSLSSLSGGQVTLLNIFGTLLRYADWPRANQQTIGENVTGICIVDEIDAHMHVDLQYTAIPDLMSLFPNVQFLVSSHSPLVALGISAKFANRAMLVSVPSGREVDAEAYSEFERALEVMKGTRAFGLEVAAAAGESAERLLVWVEGETDPTYISTAAHQLGRGELLDRIELAWIGAKEQGKKTNFNSGAGALNNALSLLRANPEILKRPVLLLYDNDGQKPDLDEESLHVRSVPDNPQNEIVEGGIENLLPVAVFTPNMFETKSVKKQNGTRVTTEELRKVQLCNYLCVEAPDAANFANFSALLDLIEALAPEEIAD